MFVAFVVLCLKQDPTVCERHEVIVDGTEMQCLVAAQSAVLPFVREGFTVKRFGCARWGKT